MIIDAIIFMMFLYFFLLERKQACKKQKKNNSMIDLPSWIIVRKLLKRHPKWTRTVKQTKRRWEKNIVKEYKIYTVYSVLFVERRTSGFKICQNSAETKYREMKM